MQLRVLKPLCWCLLNAAVLAKSAEQQLNVNWNSSDSNHQPIHKNHLLQANHLIQPIGNSTHSRRDESDSSSNIKNSWKQYTSLPLSQIHARMHHLALKYPDLVTVFTSQERYNLPSSCDSKNPKNWHDGCTNYIMKIQDTKIYSNHTKSGRKALKERPDVLLLGTLHGDERVGPTAVIEAATLLIEAAACVSSTVQTCKESSSLVQRHGWKNVQWLARLVSTRNIIVVPTANAHGYERNTRTENGWDPNRDFSFDQYKSSCMNTIAARTVNELFLDNLIQLVVTYHGGIELISYGWGFNMGHYAKSPDDMAQRQVGEGLSKYAGELYGWGQEGDKDRYYKTGDILSLLYPVRGGFEDWAYGASWRPELTTQCKPSSYGGYSASKTIYDDASLRALNVIVEVSNAKGPSSNQYGSDKDLFHAPFRYDGNSHNGFAAKHVRTAIMTVDLVQPYVEIFRFNQKELPIEFKPLRELSGRWCRVKKRVKRKKGKSANIYWKVGGAFEVNETFLVYGLWKDFGKKFNGINQLKKRDMKTVLKDSSGKFTLTSSQSGNTRWTHAELNLDPSFKAKIDLSRFSRGDEVAIYAIAMVDQSWKKVHKNNVWPGDANVSQSHTVNARTNPKWRKEKTDIQKVVQGRLHWISVPLTLRVS